jgi:hypothetical protein
VTPSSGDATGGVHGAGGAPGVAVDGGRGTAVMAARVVARGRGEASREEGKCDCAAVW